MKSASTLRGIVAVANIARWPRHRPQEAREKDTGGIARFDAERRAPHRLPPSLRRTRHRVNNSSNPHFWDFTGRRAGLALCDLPQSEWPRNRNSSSRMARPSSSCSASVSDLTRTVLIVIFTTPCCLQQLFIPAPDAYIPTSSRAVLKRNVISRSTVVAMGAPVPRSWGS